MRDAVIADEPSSTATSGRFANDCAIAAAGCKLSAAAMLQRNSRRLICLSHGWDPPWYIDLAGFRTPIRRGMHQGSEVGFGTSATCGDCEFRSAYEPRAVARPMPPKGRV